MTYVMSVRDKIIWLAGLLEGEGYFGMSRNTPRVVVNMTDEDIIKKIAEMFNVTYRPMKGKIRESHPEWKMCYNVTINGEKAISIMMSILPLMGQRRQEKIKEIIALWKKVSTPSNQKLNSRQANFIREEFDGKNYRELALKYRVSYAAIWNVVNNRVFKEKVGV